MLLLTQVQEHSEIRKKDFSGTGNSMSISKKTGNSRSCMMTFRGLIKDLCVKQRWIIRKQMMSKKAEKLCGDVLYSILQDLLRILDSIL